ncbi:hypothetical protein WJX72_010319 [[Myrmecia] bisecta]|uniref:Tubulin glycylase 3A n=1 Tax=[Myrmecia] bisecta TaxID=41462 RepID=A0AAW1PXP1_9CHLO
MANLAKFQERNQAFIKLLEDRRLQHKLQAAQVWQKNFAQWRRTNNVSTTTKVYVITGAYPDVRSALSARGYFENPDPDSQYFDIKWCLKTRSIYSPRLQQPQLANHFSRANECLTTKYGLLLSMQSLKWHYNVNYYTFYPRSFDISDPHEWRAFSACQHHLDCQDRLIDEEKQEGQPGPTDVSAEQWGMLLGCPCFVAGSPAADGSASLALEDHLRQEVQKMLEHMQQRGVQFSIAGPNNIWIMKPGGASRGRGISCSNNMEEIRERLQGSQQDPVKSRRWIVQKYIERPLIIHDRKFDIRQWVLVTGLDPLTIWFYQDSYLRFCAEDYDATNISNVYSHLSNNCIARRSTQFESGSLGDGNMWSSADFERYLATTVSDRPGLWRNHIQPQMKRIVEMTLACATDTLEQRQNSFELFGFDFAVDTSYNVWLIEVNCSPSLEHSTPVTARMVKAMVDDLFKVVLDVPVQCKGEARETQGITAPKEADGSPFTEATALVGVVDRRR